MGTLVVHCENRPNGSVVEVGTIPVGEDPETGQAIYYGGGGLGWFVNGRVYENLTGFDGTVHVGTPVPRGRLEKLPHVKGWDGRDKAVAQAFKELLAEPEEAPDSPGELPEEEAKANPGVVAAAKKEAGK